MIAFYDNKPSKLEAVGNGSYLYRWNIKEKETENINHTSEEDAGIQTTSSTLFSCEEIIVWEPLTANSVTEAVITARWDKNYEQKLINEYNAALLGMMDEAEKEKKISAYRAFLQERDRLKKMVDEDFREGE
mgnify:CR=1 FL=1